LGNFFPFRLFFLTCKPAKDWTEKRTNIGKLALWGICSYQMTMLCLQNSKTSADKESTTAMLPLAGLQ
jgi:hypothetical protein